MDTNPKPNTYLDGLRSYQLKAVLDIERHWQDGARGVLAVMPTGTGKTVLAAALAHRFEGPVLWAAHRIELIRQAKSTLSMRGHLIGEESPMFVSEGERIVVASKDSIRTAKRLERLRRRDFGLLVIDEAHHSAASTYQGIIDAWPTAKILGLTATPSRFDKRRLTAFDQVLSVLDVPTAMDEGWLVPVTSLKAAVKSVNLEAVHTQAGDFHPGELDAIMRSEESLHGIAKGILDGAGNRPTLAYCTSVASAERLAEILNRTKPGSARFVHGQTDDAQRKEIFAEFGRSYQYLCNVEIATEGTDLPLASCIAMARPTKSWGLFMQILGRGLRTAHGLSGDTAVDRRSWIRSSSKPDCLVIDFTSNTGRHSVVSALDVVGVNRTENVRVRAKRILEHATGLVSIEDALKQAEQAESEATARREARLRREAEKRALSVKPVSIDVSLTQTTLLGLGGVLSDLPENDNAKPLDPGQVRDMEAYGLNPGEFDTYAKASAAIKAERERRATGALSLKQYYLLKKRYPWVTLTMRKEEAGIWIARMKQKQGNGWQSRWPTRRG